MKLRIKKTILLNKINTVMKGISNRNLLPILSGIKLDLNESGLSLMASDNDIVVKTFIKASDKYMEIFEEGTIIVKGTYLRDIVSKLDDEFLEIERVDGLKIVISTENSIIDLNGYDELDYPNITFDTSDDFILLDENVLKESINQVSFACSTDDQRQVLKGINFKVEGNLLETSATDSFRLAKKTIDLENPVKEKYNVTIPGENLVKLASLLEEKDENVKMHIFNNKVIFEKDNLIFQTRIINGNYPDISNLFPKEVDFTLILNRNQFYNVIDRASIFTNNKDKNIITLQTDLDNITIKSSSQEVGKTEEKMPAMKSDDSKDIRISFSVVYMKESINSYTGEVIKISFTGEERPIIITSDDIPELQQLVLPIRDY